MWTQFWDMHSGGSLKINPYNQIYIEAPEREARELFRERFGRDPDNITCHCCGEDYAVEEYGTLEEATEYHRHNKTLEEYRQSPNVLILSWIDLGTPEEVEADLRDQIRRGQEAQRKLDELLARTSQPESP